MERKVLIVDLAALAAYLVAANPALTGIGVHEWVGLGVTAVLLAHLAMHADWIVRAARDAFARPTWARTGCLALDVLIVVVLATATVSGLLVSGSVLQALGLYAPGYYFWDPLHAVSAKVLLALLLVHLAVHARLIAGHVKGAKEERHGGRSER